MSAATPASQALADLFRLPIVHLVDNPGFMIGREAEMAGTIRYGVQAMPGELQQLAH